VQERAAQLPVSLVSLLNPLTDSSVCKDVRKSSRGARSLPFSEE